MKVKNLSKRNYCHSMLDDEYKLKLLILAPNEIKDVPDNIATSWIKTGDVEEYVEPKDAKKLADENEQLKQELAKIKSTKTTKTNTKSGKSTKAKKNNK